MSDKHLSSTEAPENKVSPTKEQGQWGEVPKDHFGYDSDEERLAKRGMEDWEMVENIPDSQKKVPYWFLGVIVAVVLIAVGLSFPFWGDRPGYERDWINWGFGFAIAYIVMFGLLVYYMVNLYGSERAGKLDSDTSADDDKQESTGTPAKKDD